MEFIRNYVMGLCAVALLSTCADMLLPNDNGGIRGSVRFALGLIFTAVLISPIAALVT